MFSYEAYGLCIHSELSLPELIPGDGSPNVFVRMGRIDRALRGKEDTTTSETGITFWAKSEEACLFQDHLGACLVRGGSEIIADPAPNADEAAFRLLLLGPALAMLLHQRGLFVLHSSGVVVSGGVVTFMGGPGQGKSTTAASLHARGHELVADDLLAIEIGDGENPLVFPGFPQFKLWPDAVEALGDDPESLLRIRPQLEKRARRVTGGFSRSSYPLKAIYVLAEGTTPEIESIWPQEALMELAQHSYYLPAMKDSDAPRHFQQCAQLVKKVPVRRLRRPRSIPGLPALAKLVEEDVASSVC